MRVLEILPKDVIRLGGSDDWNIFIFYYELALVQAPIANGILNLFKKVKMLQKELLGYLFFEYYNCEICGFFRLFDVLSDKRWDFIIFYALLISFLLFPLLLCIIIQLLRNNDIYNLEKSNFLQKNSFISRQIWISQLIFYSISCKIQHSLNIFLLCALRKVKQKDSEIRRCKNPLVSNFLTRPTTVDHILVYNDHDQSKDQS